MNEEQACSCSSSEAAANSDFLPFRKESHKSYILPSQFFLFGFFILDFSVRSFIFLLFFQMHVNFLIHGVHFFITWQTYFLIHAEFF